VRWRVLGYVKKVTHRLAGRDLEDLGRQADGALDEELLVLSTVDEIVRDY
jgi:hypothetical protein